jgi:putative addiction module killer protein
MDTITSVPFLIQQTELFAKWLAGLRDLRARIAIARRIDRIAAGTLGDVKPVGGEISELRVDVGPVTPVLHDASRDCRGAACRRRQAHAENGYQACARTGIEV